MFFFFNPSLFFWLWEICLIALLYIFIRRFRALINVVLISNFCSPITLYYIFNIYMSEHFEWLFLREIYIYLCFKFGPNMFINVIDDFG